MRNVGLSSLNKAIARPELARTTHNVQSPNLAAAAIVAAPLPATATYRSLYQQCHHRRPASLLLTPSSSSSSSSSSSNARASLHTTPVHLKKTREPGRDNPKKRLREEHKKWMADTAAAVAAAAADDAGSEGSKHPTPKPEEPLDFADVRSRLAQHDERFTLLLKKLRTGGRFNPDVLGALRVAAPDAPKTAAAGPAVTYPLRELAQVVPRGGRTVSILVHEAGAIKSIMSAVQASPDFNQQPQRDPDNELELTLKIEPEQREDVQRRVKAVCHDWRERVRLVRQRRDKLHATWRKEGTLGPDMRRTVDKELEKVIRAKMAEIENAEKDALKAAESGK